MPPGLRRRRGSWRNTVKEIAPLAEKFKRGNRHAVPKIEKIVVNMGVGEAIAEKKYLEEAVAALAQISGQKPLVTKSRQSIAGFRLREGMPIGCKVTLRGADVRISRQAGFVALPRVRDFRGLNPDGFDGRGNYSLGLSEQLVFPELNPDKYTRTQGMNITVVISGHSDEESRELLRRLGMPFKVPETKGTRGAA